jgi:hypothetical protein
VILARLAVELLERLAPSPQSLAGRMGRAEV